MRLNSLILGPAALLLAACSDGASTPNSAGGLARSEVEAIVKDYLVQHPEVLEQALASLEQKQRADHWTAITQTDDPSLGPKNAPITLVEYFDYNCGFCKGANKWVFDELENKRKDVRVVFKEYPILRQSSLTAAQAALAANRQGKYKEMHLALMHSRALSQTGADGNEDPAKTMTEIERLAKIHGVDFTRLKKDMADPELEKIIKRSYAEADAAQIKGTPGFYINGEFVDGFNQARLEELISKARANKK